MNSEDYFAGVIGGLIQNGYEQLIRDDEARAVLASSGGAPTAAAADPAVPKECVR